MQKTLLVSFCILTLALVFLSAPNDASAFCYSTCGGSGGGVSCTASSRLCVTDYPPFVYYCQVDSSCGGCTAGSCPGTDYYCSSGTCVVCPSGFRNCTAGSPDTCETNITNNNQNCGYCGNPCASGKICSGSLCVCGTGVQCGLNCCTGSNQVCYNMQCCTPTSCTGKVCGDNGCGVACGAACTGGKVCNANGTACVCPPTQATCGSICCQPNESCENNICVSNTQLTCVGPCGNNGQSCGGAICNSAQKCCHYPSSPSFCSTASGCGCTGDSCGTTDSYCSSGVCTTCSTGTKNCNSTPGCETNVYTDSANCLTCGHACPNGGTCSGGVCSSTCASGDGCKTGCTPADSDCGSSNDSCPSPKECVPGGLSCSSIGPGWQAVGSCPSGVCCEYHQPTSSGSATCSAGDGCKTGCTPADPDCGSNPQIPQSGSVTGIENPVNATSVEGIVGTIGNFIFWLALALAPLLYIIGGVMLITAGGDPTKAAKAKSLFLYTTIGLVVILFARGLVALLQSVLGVKSQ